MLTLAIETSGTRASVALRKDGQLVAERSLPTVAARHARELAGAIESAFQTASCRPRECDLIGVSIGPGSFTGLRVGVSFAKMFAYSVDANLVAVDTLLATAWCCAEYEEVAVVSDAQREEVFLGIYEQAESGWQQRRPIEIVPVESLSHQLPKHVPITGPGLVRFADRLDEWELLGEEFRFPRAASIGDIAESMAACEQYSDIGSLEPAYYRKSYAEEKATASLR